MSDVLRPSLPDARVGIELGRYIVGECGIYVTRVVDRKDSRGKTFLVVDGGSAPPARRLRELRSGNPPQLSGDARQPRRRRRRQRR